MSDSQEMSAEARMIPNEDLLLDPFNPRLPQDSQGSDDQTHIASLMCDIFQAADVAASMAAFGFYAWETLIVVPEGDQFIVVEGNRRLTAVRGLTDPNFRDKYLDKKKWQGFADDLLEKGHDLTTLPCVVVANRAAANPALGHRHISGILGWTPHAQGAFVAQKMIDEDGRSFEETAELVGKPLMWVKDAYRQHKVFSQIQEAGVDGTEIIETYSLLNVALGSPGLREFIGCATSIDPGETPIANPNARQLEEFVDWIWGEESVAEESRQIGKLGEVVANEKGLAAIREGKTLNEALQIINDDEEEPIDVAKRYLKTSIRSLGNASLEGLDADDELGELVQDVIDEVARINNELDHQ